MYAVSKRLVSILAQLRKNTYTVKNSSEFVLKQDGHHYKQIFGCAVGSPISSLLADLVIEITEEITITTALNPHKWWVRYVDDSHSCLKNDQVDAFHQHLNSVNANIQFILGLEDTNGYCLPFHYNLTSRRGKAVGDLQRASPCGHTDRHLDLLSHHPSRRKRSVVNTLLLRARNILSTSKGKREETRQMKGMLQENNYQSGFIKRCERALATKPTKPTRNSYVVLTYINDVSERIDHVLKQKSLRVSYQPQRVLFLDRNNRTKPSVHRFSQCDVVYYGQTERSLTAQVSEHKKAVVMFDHNSKLA